MVKDLEALVPWPNAPGNDTFQGPVRTEDYLLPRFAGYFDGLPACEPPLTVPRR